MSVAAQLTLDIAHDPHEHLWPYWQERLREWVRDALYYRHSRGCTGWSTVTSGFMFARLLFRSGQLSRQQFRRYWKFNRRIQRMEGESP